LPEVVLALGSNLGESAAILQGAVDDLGRTPGIALLAVSSVFETDPVGGPEQDDYLNAVVLASTDLTSRELLSQTQRIEADWHRVRATRWGPRTLDIDVIAMGDLVLDTPDLVIPHPRAHERAFVLVPWSEVAPDATVPGRGSVRALRDAVDESGVRRTDVRLSIARGAS
jgi:2-amino-4-hydroxy-6-hydroxymethyldihydropteridine diphosphokinase